jgi:hypothetical protein
MLEKDCVDGHIHEGGVVGSEKGSMTSADTSEPKYLVTNHVTNATKDVPDANASHSIEKYPEDNNNI